MRHAVTLCGLAGLGLLAPVAGTTTTLRPTDLEVIAKFSEHLVKQSIAPEEPRGRGLLSRLARELGASDTECNWYLTGNLATYVAECNDMNQAIRALSNTENCQTTFNLNQQYLSSKVCGSACFQPMLDTLGAMAKSGCMVQSVLNTWCQDCPKGTTCVSGQCLPSCQTSAQCSCNGTCSQGGCMTPDQATIGLTKLGVWGMKAGMEQLCYRPTTGQDYCAAQMYTALNGPGLSLQNVCSRLKTTGCCAATNINFGMKCALTGDVISTSMGNFTVEDLEAICPDQDFRTSCATAGTIPPKACVDGYVDTADGVPLPIPGRQGGRAVGQLLTCV